MVKPSTKVRKKVKKNVAEGIAHVYSKQPGAMPAIFADSIGRCNT